MDDTVYCAFCGRVIQNEYQFCPYCGVQCKDDLPVCVLSDPPQERSTIERLTEIESTLENMENELDHFLATRNS